MDITSPVFGTGFLIGLGIGLAVALYFWFSAWLHRRGLVKEVASLKEHLHRQMEISAKGTDSQQKELEKLRQQNENLRITNASLKQKPGRAEVEMLATYERALRVMNTKAPGFAPAWEQAIKDAEAEVAATDSGVLPLLRKALKPVFSRIGGSTPIEEAESPATQRQLLSGESKPEKSGT